MDVELKEITKSFGSVVANKNVNLQIKGGEVLGLLGENGAGKSTLMNMLSGLYKPDSGKILVNGNPVEFDGPGDSINAGIGMVHQHFMLVPVFSVSENVILGVEPTKNFNFLDIKKARHQVEAINNEYGLHVPPDELIENLPVGIQQRVEILKVLFRSADLLVLDEPTAVLTPQEVDEFFTIVRTLRDAGKAIVFITHKLHEILEISDRVSVLRQGQVTGEGDPKNLSEADLAEMMVGRPVSFTVDKILAKPEVTMLEMNDVCMLNDNDDFVLENVSLNVRSGEIVGVAGVQGNGQTELAEAITGMSKIAKGKIVFDGFEISSLSVREIHKLGMAHIPEDRRKSGMVDTFTVAENMVLNNYYSENYRKGLSIDWQKVQNISAGLCVKFDVRTPSIHLKAGSLSGGNQQKMVVARELERNIKFVIASQPTRGVDVGSIEYIHERLVSSRDSGNGVLIISSELDEIMGLSDRILVMFEGRIVAEFDNHNNMADRNKIGIAMAGGLE